MMVEISPVVMLMMNFDTAMKTLLNNAPELNQAADFMLNRCAQLLVVTG
jgi:hypothetical protein